MRKLNFFIICLFITTPCSAATITVNWDGSGDYLTIQEGINAAIDGDTVVVAQGTYTGPGNRDLDFFGRAISVRGHDPNDPNFVAATIIDCNGTGADPHRGFYFRSGEGADSVVAGLTITNGFGLYGGGIRCSRASSPTISHCRVIGNWAYYKNVGGRGAGIYCSSGSHPSISHCTIMGNTVYGIYGSGGGIYCYESNAKIDNCIIAENTTEKGTGGGIIANRSSQTISHCTITGNSGEGICRSTSGKLTVTHCIVWNNKGPELSGDDISVSYSDVEGGYTGVGNIDADPLFVVAGGSDYHLSVDSPCINAGDPCYTSDPGETDIDSEQRLMGARVDMGADEFNLEAPFIAISPREFEFIANEGRQQPEDQVLTVHNGGVGTLNWEITYDCDWLEVGPSSGSSAGEANEVVLSADISGLVGGAYNCELMVSDPCALNSPQIVEVNLVIQGPAIELSAEEFEFDAVEGGTNPDDQMLTIRNSGGGILDWEISYDCNWLNVEPNSGSSTGEANEVVLSVDITGLSGGSYNCEVTISDLNASNSPQVVRVHLGVYGPAIELSASEFEFDAVEGRINPADQILIIRNSGVGTLNWEISYDCNWLDVDPNTGSSTGEPNEVILSVDISGLDCGLYDCTVTISDPNAGNSPQTVEVKLFIFVEGELDFGDCPDPTYPTLLIHDGACHVIDPNVFLGGAVDAEFDGQPTIRADGDDVNCVPDEDGVFFASSIFTNCTRDVNVVASCEGKLDAWIDFNADGDWADPCEQIFVSQPLDAGSNILTFSIPSDASIGDTYARFRFSTAGGLPYDGGPAPDGEVEDYMVSILRDCWPLVWFFWPPPDDFGYEDWVEWNKPECWCYPRQCRGDIDGKRILMKWVQAADLTIFRQAFFKQDHQLRNVPNGICADLDHNKVMLCRVQSADLAIFRTYFLKPDAQVPECFGYIIFP